MTTQTGKSVKDTLPGEVCPFGKGDQCCGNYPQQNTEEILENVKKCPHFIERQFTPVEGIQEIPDTLSGKPIPAFLQNS